jgi:hypothetical protein
MAEAYAHLAEKLRDRPSLREALRSGKVLFRAAQVVLPVAKGEAEAAWVERASKETVRALEKAVREDREARSLAPSTGSGRAEHSVRSC